MRNAVVNIIGAGYAGIESALTLASYGVEVHLFDGTFVMRNEVEPSPENEKLMRELQALGVQSVDEDDDNLHDLFKKMQFLVQKNEKIMFFHENVNVLSLSEPTIIATGNQTGDKLFEHIKTVVGANHAHKTRSVYPIFEGDIEGIRVLNWLYCPVDEATVKNVANFLKDKSKGEDSIERYALSEKFLRAKSLKPAVLENKIFYATLKFFIDEQKYILQGFQSQLESEQQDKLFSLLPPLKNARVIRYGAVEPFTHINASACLNANFQCLFNPNIFFAGSILGYEGEALAIAEGHLCALNMLSHLWGQFNTTLPNGSAIQKIVDKIFSPQPIKNEQNSVICDIIRSADEQKAVLSLKQFKEELNARISRHNDLCSKKGW